MLFLHSVCFLQGGEPLGLNILRSQVMWLKHSALHGDTYWGGLVLPNQGVLLGKAPRDFHQTLLRANRAPLAECQRQPHPVLQHPVGVIRELTATPGPQGLPDCQVAAKQAHRRSLNKPFVKSRSWKLLDPRSLLCPSFTVFGLVTG